MDTEGGGGCMVHCKMSLSSMEFTGVQCKTHKATLKRATMRQQEFCTILHPTAPYCTLLHPSAPYCTRLHPSPPQCTILYPIPSITTTYQLPLHPPTLTTNNQIFQNPTTSQYTLPTLTKPYQISLHPINCNYNLPTLTTP